LGEQREDATISAIVMLSTVKPVVTKKGDRMAIVQIEDLTGQAEAVVFPKSFERIGDYIIPDARLMIWGKVDRRDDRNQFIIDDAEPVETVRMLMVELDPQRASDIEEQHRLRTVLLEHRGEDERAKVPVVAIIMAPHKRQFVRLGAQFRVQDYQTAVNALIRAGFQARASALVNA
jgi:DNA polymerase-3 subunit alpha